MCAFYHHSEEKAQIEYESENFYDPILEGEDYESEGEYSPEDGEGEFDSHEESHKSESSNTNTNTNFITPESGEENSETDLHSMFPVESANMFPFGETDGKNAWDNEDFALEEAMKKASSYNPTVDFEATIDDKESQGVLGSEKMEEQKYIPPSPSTPPVVTKITRSSPKENLEDQAKVEKEVSNEIKSIAHGNLQQMDTSKIVNSIMSQCPSASKSKFFDLEDGIDADEDLLDEIFESQYPGNIDLDYQDPEGEGAQTSGPDLLTCDYHEIPMKYFGGSPSVKN